QAAVLVFTGAQEHLVPAHQGFLRESATLLGQPNARPLGTDRRRSQRRDSGFALAGLLGGSALLLLFALRFPAFLVRGRERLRGLTAVAVESHLLQSELPALFVSRTPGVAAGVVGEVDGPAGGARQDRLGCRHHAHV